MNSHESQIIDEAKGAAQLNVVDAPPFLPLGRNRRFARRPAANTSPTPTNHST